MEELFSELERLENKNGLDDAFTLPEFIAWAQSNPNWTGPVGEKWLGSKVREMMRAGLLEAVRKPYRDPWGKNTSVCAYRLKKGKSSGK